MKYALTFAAEFLMVLCIFAIAISALFLGAAL